MTAAVLALLLASSAKTDDWTPYSKQFSTTVVELLGRLPSTREHAAFLREERIDLVVTDAIDKVSDSVIGAYDMSERKMYIDEVRLLNGADELLDSGAPPDEVGEILAWKMLPTIVHEIRHAMTHRAARRELGAWLALPYVEPEMLSFYDEVLALEDMIRERPKLWGKDKILSIEESHAVSLRAWERDRKDLDGLVLATYRDLGSVMLGPREKLLDDAREGAKDGAPRVRALYAATAAQLRDDRSYARLEDFFRARLKAGRKRLAEARP